MNAFGDALVYEASYQVWLARHGARDSAEQRAIWLYGPFARPADAPIPAEIRARQAARWLRITARTAGRR